jgi:hypothetical protein
MLTTYDKDLAPGARNAIRVCLNVQPHERVTVIADRDCEDIAASLVHEIEEVGAPYKAFILEDVAERPLVDLPPAIAEDMEQSQVQHPGRARAAQRARLAHAAHRHRQPPQDAPWPHGQHQPADDARGHARRFPQGRSPQLESDRHRPQREASARDDEGGSAFHRDAESELQVAEDERPHQPRTSGATCPGGEVFTTPGNVDGTLVIDGVVGDFLCEKYGSLQRFPLTLPGQGTTAWSRRTASNKELESDFWKYTHTDANSDRVGEFAIGTNIELKEVIGHILQDEKFRAFMSRSAIRTGNTRVPTGSRPLTSMSSRHASTSGSTIGKSWPTENS